jgi:endonuclease/exonuclease/phosphatase family metal-dependent hydrolase
LFSSLQIRLLAEKANALAEKWDKIPIVLAGDFNSTPDVCFYFLLTCMILLIIEQNYVQQVSCYATAM